MSTDPRLLVLHEGRFGAAVADRLAGRALALTQAIPGLEALVADTDFVVLALGRRYPSATEVVDDTCARLGTPWSAATLEDSALLVGPVVVPGTGACHACFRKRWLTHAAHPDRQRMLDAWFETDHTAGCDGFPPAAVSLAEAALALDRAEAAEAAGRLRIFDLLRGSTQETRVVRVHGCPRCGRSEPGGRRYVDQLRATLTERGLLAAVPAQPAPAEGAP